MKALSLCEPWAWAILSGIKSVENRSWGTRYRGPLLIHASKSRRWLQAGVRQLPELGSRELALLAYGMLVGVVELVDCRPVEDCTPGRFVEGPWCWIVEKPVRLPKPIPYKGQLGLFEVPYEFVRDPVGYLLYTQQ